jgi:riboflavin synthase
MFTGLVEAVGKVRSITRDAKGARLVVEAPFAAELKRGDSVAVSGACLTAIDLWPDAFSADVSNETLVRTSMGAWRAGTPVNLERALAVGQRLGGHYVLGHVDGLGRIERVSGLGDAWRIDVAFPAAMAPLFIDKGSVAIDGISLTINEVGSSSFWVAVIPETWSKTTLGRRKAGDAVQLEGDVLGKYVLRALAATGRAGGLTLEKLAEAGFAG